MSPKSVAQVHRTICSTDSKEAEKLSRMALSRESAESVKQAIDDFNSVIFS